MHTHRSGKTSIRRVLFEKISPHETLIEPASVELEKWVFPDVISYLFLQTPPWLTKTNDTQKTCMERWISGFRGLYECAALPSVLRSNYIVPFCIVCDRYGISPEITNLEVCMANIWFIDQNTDASQCTTRTTQKWQGGVRVNNYIWKLHCPRLCHRCTGKLRNICGRVAEWPLLGKPLCCRMMTWASQWRCF